MSDLIVVPSCDTTYPDERNTNTHRCLLPLPDHPTNHQCACGRRWPNERTHP